MAWFILNYGPKSGSNVKLAGGYVGSLHIASNSSEMQTFCASAAWPEAAGFQGYHAAQNVTGLRDKSSSCFSAQVQKCRSRAQGRTKQYKTYFPHSSTFSSSFLMESYYLEEQLVQNL